MKKQIPFTVSRNLSGSIRLDVYISEQAGLLSRSQLKARNVTILLKGTESKLSKKVKAGDEGVLIYEEDKEEFIIPEKVDLNIIFENADLIVINKPQGLVVHPACGNRHGTLAHGLLYHCRELKNEYPENMDRPGIVHRLDKDTSGVIIAAKNRVCQDFLASQFRNRETEKVYLALVKGQLKKGQGIIETGLVRDPKNIKKYTAVSSGGKTAVTRYALLKQFREFAFVILKPKTGRTHQLRVHMKYLGNPILGDPLYSGNTEKLSLMLHAYKLSLRIPGQEKVSSFWAPMPERFKTIISHEMK